MGTQDENNKAEPQDEFLSGFKIKSRDESSYAINNKGSESASQKAKSGTQTSSGVNSFQQKNNGDNEQFNSFLDETPKTGFLQKLKEKFAKESDASGDPRQKVMVVLIPILFVIMVFMFRQVLSKSPQESQGADTTDTPVTSTNKVSEGEIDWAIPEPLPIEITRTVTANHSNDISVDGQLNPTAGEDSNSMDIKGIIYSYDKPSIVIGKKIVYLNQEINGIIVCEIHKDYIVFEKDGTRWTQKVSEEIKSGSQDIENPENLTQNLTNELN